MKTTSASSRTLDQFLQDPGKESQLPLNNITLIPAAWEDYAFTSDEINNEIKSLTNIGISQRIVVEQIGNHYQLIGPLLLYLALESAGFSNVSCIVRSGDKPQIQDVLSFHLNSGYSSLSPLVLSRLIVRLNRLYPVVKSLSGSSLGNKRDWIADILGISSSAVLRYSYISTAPTAIQLRCNNPQFPYLCLRDTRHFTESQYRKLLDELIHFELHSRYQTITASELSAIILDIDKCQDHRISTDYMVVGDHASDMNEPFAQEGISLTQYSNTNHSSNRALAQMPALYDSLTENYYQNLRDSFIDQIDDNSLLDTGSVQATISHKSSYVMPDTTLREISYQLYCLSQMPLAGGQRTLNYACLRSILESVQELYDKIT